MLQSSLWKAKVSYFTTKSRGKFLLCNLGGSTFKKTKTIWKKNSPNTGLSVSNTRTPDGLGSNQGDSSEAQPTPWWAPKPAEKSELISNSAHLAPGFQETGRGHIIDTQFIKALLDLHIASKLPRAKAWPASLGLHGVPCSPWQPAFRVT